MTEWTPIAIDPNKWYEHSNNDVIVCCDCGLVHHIKVKVENGKVWLKMKRNNRMTAEERKKMRIRIVKEQ